MEVSYTPGFLRMLKVLPKDQQNEAIEKIELFQDHTNHKQLKVHKLKNRLKGRYSFTINYKTRIVFQYIGTPKQALLLAIGDHDVYKN